MTSAPAGSIAAMYYEADYDRSRWIRLSEDEVERACAQADKMYDKSHADGKQDAYGFDDVDGAGRRAQRQGACAEVAVAKALGIYWSALIDQGDRSDLPFEIEVRCIGRDHYGVRVRERDEEERRIVGAIPPSPVDLVGRWRIPGWCYAIEAREAEWEMAPNGRPPFWAVPQSALRPLLELRLLIAEEMIRQARREFERMPTSVTE